MHDSAVATGSHIVVTRDEDLITYGNADSGARGGAVLFEWPLKLAPWADLTLPRSDVL